MPAPTLTGSRDGGREAPRLANRENTFFTSAPPSSSESAGQARGKRGGRASSRLPVRRRGAARLDFRARLPFLLPTA